MNSYMASNGSRFMITWIIFKKHLLKGKASHKIRRPRHSKFSQLLIYCILSCVGMPYEYKFIEIAYGVQSHMTSNYTWGAVTTLHDSRSALRRSLDTSFGLSQFHSHDSWLMCKVALSTTKLAINST